MRILFMGTPDFAVASLDALLKDGQEIVGVVTSPDKPAGRGRQIQFSDVKKYALEANLKILQPEKLKSPEFLADLSSLNPQLIVVVAFRMLPEVVWSFPSAGTINLHASLLPQYRGAAPINRVIMNGETETGVTTFFIERDIDTGKIIMQEKIAIGPEENAGLLHDRIMEKGAEVLVKTIHAIKKGNTPGIEQSGLLNEGQPLKMAPKIFKDDCRISWDNHVHEVFNHVRGLSPYPGAWTRLVSPSGQEKILKVFACHKLERDTVFQPGTIITNNKSRFEIACHKGLLNLEEVQLEGKKKMGIQEFMRGMQDLSSYTIV